MARKKKQIKEDPFPHGYICHECATAKGLRWPKGHCATAHYEDCPYCNQNKSLCAVTDWLKPGEKELKSWD